MKRITAILILCLCPLFACAQVPQAKLAALDSLMHTYVAAMSYAGLDEKEAECDTMILTASDTLIRSHVATGLFRLYRDSPVMGDEEVAIYIWDKWFAKGDLPMEPGEGKTLEDEYYDAKLFADFNRSTLIGAQAPVIKAKSPCGCKVKLPKNGRPAIIYFYDTSCSKCKLESKLLPTVLSDREEQLDFYAFYTGSDKKAWKEFRGSFSLGRKNIRVIHVWDPDAVSDYLRLYGVISTPKIYITTAGGQILGRRLELDNIPQVLDLLQKM